MTRRTSTSIVLILLIILAIKTPCPAFDADKIADNANELLQTIGKLKPAASKGLYIKSIVLSSTMGPGIKIDSKVAS